MLRVSNLYKLYHGCPVLEDVSFEIPDESIAGIIGPNGAGKSTVLKIITGFEPGDGGEVYFKGKRVLKFGERMKLFSYMPEYVELYPEYNVGDFITFIQEAVRHESKPLLKRLGLDQVWHKRIRHLSKGYKQRLKLFTALANDKPMLVLDEPFDGFDPIQLLDILDLIKQENRKGRGFLLSIHQLSDAQKICDYYILLSDGKVAAQGKLKTLRERFGTKNATLEEIFMAALR